MTDPARHPDREAAARAHRTFTRMLGTAKARRLQRRRPPRRVFPSPVPPSLDTTQITCEVLGKEALTPDLPIDDWRRGVAWALRELGRTVRWDQAAARANRWEVCRRASFPVVRECIHQADGEYLYPFHCELRTCPECARRLSRAVASTYSKVLLRRFRQLPDHVRAGMERPTDWRPASLPHGGPKGRRWRLLTLTRHNPGGFDPERLLEQVRETRRMVTELWAETWGSYRRERVRAADAMVGAVFGIEVAPDGMVHAHVLVYGHYWPQEDLRDRWHRITGDSYVVDIQAVRPKRKRLQELAAQGRKPTWRDYLTAGVLETLKYATKPPEAKGAKALRAVAAIEYAYAGTRRIGAFGIFHGQVTETLADPEYCPPREGICCPVCEARAHLGDLMGPGGTAARLRFGAAWHPATHPPPHHHQEDDHGHRRHLG